MTIAVSSFAPWIGAWSGLGESQMGQQTLIRTDFAYALDGTAMQMHFEAWDPGMETLFHGVQAVLAPAPTGVLRAVAFSTIHGPLILELTPDDEGVMALAGESRSHNRISVAFVEDAPDRLLFTAFWRPVGAPLAGADGPRMTCPLERAVPWQPPTSPDAG